MNNRQLLIEIMCTRIPGASPYWAGKAADIMLAKGWTTIPQGWTIIQAPEPSVEDHHETQKA
jgi:hypothetical protein